MPWSEERGGDEERGGEEKGGEREEFGEREGGEGTTVEGGGGEVENGVPCVGESGGEDGWEERGGEEDESEVGWV